jgi:Na+-driven multidrug efflux pump
VQASIGLIETYFVGWLGTDALAGIALVFPLVMLMQVMSAGAIGGSISSAVARTLGGCHRADANALALHALVIAGVFGLSFMLAVLGVGPSLYRADGSGRPRSPATAWARASNICWSRSSSGSAGHLSRWSARISAPESSSALRIAWIAAAAAAAITEAIGLTAAAFPHLWLSLFDTDPAMLDAGSRYLHLVGPFYGLFGLGVALYFASQGIGRLRWPFIANFTRLAAAGGEGWLALRLTGDLSYIFSRARRSVGVLRADQCRGGCGRRMVASIERLRRMRG